MSVFNPPPSLSVLLTKVNTINPPDPPSLSTCVSVAILRLCVFARLLLSDVQDTATPKDTRRDHGRKTGCRFLFGESQGGWGMGPRETQTRTSYT